MSDYEFFKSLTDQRVAKEKEFSQNFSWAVLLFVILSISGVDTTIAIKTALLDLTIPKVYLVFVLSFMTALSILDMVGAGITQGYQTVAAQRFAGRFPNLTAWMAPQTSTSAWTSVFVSRFDSFVAPKSLGIGAGVAVLLIILPIGLVYLAIYASQIIHIVSFYTRPNYAFMGHIVNVISIMMLAAPIFLVWFTLHKVPLRKNQAYIRWRFLHKIYRLHRITAYPSAWFENQK